MLAKQKIALAIAGGLGLLSATVSFGQELPPTRTSPVFPASIPRITTSVPTAADVPSSPRRMIRAEVANLVCLHKLPVAAQSDGMIEKLLADEGRTVAKGDPLLVIDSRVAAAELEVARKELEAAQKKAAQTANVEYAKAAARVAINEYNAENELLSKGSAAKAQVERRRLEADKTRWGIEVAIVEHETEALAAQVAAAKLDAATVRLEMFNVLSPFDGVIVERLRDEGEWIRAGEPVLRLMHMNEMKVEAMVKLDGFSFSDLQRAPMTVTVAINPSQKYEIPTFVEFVNPELEDDRVRVTARIQNQKVGDSWLLGDGMKVIAELELNTAQ